MKNADEGTIVEELTRSESELWSYMAKGNGWTCPLIDVCSIRQSGAWCNCDNKERFNGLVDGSQAEINQYDFYEQIIVCRVFQLVEIVAAKCVRLGGVYESPVPVDLVTLFDKQHMIEVRELPLRSIQGAVWPLGDRWIIYVAANETSRSKKFTLFHEGFHILSHNVSSTMFPRERIARGAFNELVAETFAGNIIMPKKMVEKKWREVRDLDRMARIFDVPKPAIWGRLKLLRLV